MQRITNWIRRNWQALSTWIINRLTYLKRWCIKHLTITAFKICIWSRKHAQQNYNRNVVEMIKGMSGDGYDEQVMLLYKFVRRKQAFVFKTKIMGAGKGIKHFKMLMIETPDGMIECKIATPGSEDFNKHDYVNDVKHPTDDKTD